MRKWKCVKTENYGFTVGKIYESDDRGYNIKANDGYCYDRLSACEPLKSSNGFEFTRFEEIKEEQIDRETMIEKLDNFCINQSCVKCVFVYANCGFKDMSDEDLTSAYNLAFGVKEDKVEEIKEDKKMNKFKVGDKVRIIGRESGHGFKIGDIVELYKKSSDGDFRGRQEGDSRDFGNWIRQEEMELIKENKSTSKSLTITTSDSTTTLTDGTHTTSINRYYTDKHNERNAISIVIDKYYDELAEIERVSKLPKVGDKVRVVDADGTYSRYDNWLIENNIEYKYALLWQENYSPKNDSTGFIRAIHPHLACDNRILALVETESHAYIINIEGLEVIR